MGNPLDGKGLTTSKTMSPSRARNFVTCVKTFIYMFPSRERWLTFEISVHHLTHLDELVPVTLPVLIEKLISGTIELNGALAAYNNVILKDVMLLTLLKISASCVLLFYSVMVK